MFWDYHIFMDKAFIKALFHCAIYAFSKPDYKKSKQWQSGYEHRNGSWAPTEMKILIKALIEASSCT